MKRTRKWSFGSPTGAAVATALCLLMIAGGAVGARAQDDVGGGVTPLKMQDGVLYLSLEDAIAIALERNLSLVVERYRTSESELRLDESQGIYDINSRVDLSAFDESTPQASQLDGAEVRLTEGNAWNFGLSKLLPSGGTASVSWNNSRFETNSRFASINPSFSVGFDFSFVQPLLRNSGRETVETGIRVARNNVEISQENFELQVIGVLQQVEDAYWSLVEAKAQLEVAEESLALAEKLHEQNRVRVEVGTLAPLELVTSEAGIATRKEEIIRARALVGDSEDLLRQLLNLNEAEAWAATIEPQTDPEMTPLELDVEGAVATALERRPELRASRLGQENLAIDAMFRANQAKPALDLSLTYARSWSNWRLTAAIFRAQATKMTIRTLQPVHSMLDSNRRTELQSNLVFELSTPTHSSMQSISWKRVCRPTLMSQQTRRSGLLNSASRLARAKTAYATI